MPGMDKVKKILKILRKKGFQSEIPKREVDLAIMEGAGVIHWQTRKNYLNLLEELGYLKIKNELVYEIVKLSD